MRGARQSANGLVAHFGFMDSFDPIASIIEFDDFLTARFPVVEIPPAVGGVDCNADLDALALELVREFEGSLPSKGRT